MTNGLLSQSVVRLFGRVVEGVQIDTEKLIETTINKQLRDLLLTLKKEYKDEQEKQGEKAIEQEKLDPKRLRLARIYAFSFEGRFYTLPKPTLFLVHGETTPAGKDTGLANKKDVEFETGIERWKFDKDDIMLRADIVIGTLDDILIDATFSPTSKYPITSRAGTPQEASWRDGQMIQRNALR